MSYVEISNDTYEIDLNAVRDGNQVVAVIGIERPQLVPAIGARVYVQDEDGHLYDAVVESVRPDRRIYLRAKWETQRAGTPTFRESFGGQEVTEVRGTGLANVQ